MDTHKSDCCYLIDLVVDYKIKMFSKSMVVRDLSRDTCQYRVFWGHE
jgi:hypothetical protein